MLSSISSSSVRVKSSPSVTSFQVWKGSSLSGRGIVVLVCVLQWLLAPIASHCLWVADTTGAEGRATMLALYNSVAALPAIVPGARGEVYVVPLHRRRGSVRVGFGRVHESPPTYSMV